MKILPSTPEAVDLFRRGTLTFAEMESNGMRIDTEYLKRAQVRVGEEIKSLQEQMRECEEFKLQRKRFGAEASVTSREQYSTVLAKDLGYTFTRMTAGGKAQMDETILDTIGTPYAVMFRKMEKLRKLHSTYLVGIYSEVCNGYLHAFFNLHLVRSFRSSSSEPNFQNIPIRDPDISREIRQAFVPREGYRLVEIDYSSQEVRIACCLSKDDNLIRDTLEGDMHRDMAAECFMLGQGEVTKALRGLAKGGFVFAEFYGDWYKQVTKNLWGGLEGEGITLANGVPVIEHLRKHGIVERGPCAVSDSVREGSFEKHIQTVEHNFWHKRFYAYHKYRQQLVEEYRARGWFQLVTGFTCSGVYKKNQIINYPIQGPAFHCIVWAANEINKRMKLKKFRSLLVGQIHDSLVADVHESELDDYIELARKVMVTEIAEHWRWITTPLEISVETSETNWHEKKPYGE